MNFLVFFIFIFGTIIGSFLNCIIFRLHQKQSFFLKRSFCPHCQKTLAWFDLIPVLSFFLLKGRCRWCHKKISWQYPLVEMAVGFLFVLPFIFPKTFLIYQNSPNLILAFFNYFYYFLIVSCFVIIFVYDLKHFIIPDKILIFLILIVFLCYLFLIFYFDLFSFQKLKPIFLAFFSGIGASFFFFLLFFFSKGRWLGFGDVKLAFLLGLILGWPKIIVAIFLTYFIGGIIGIGLIFLKKKSLKSEIPFAPFLLTGTLLSLYFGEDLLVWYLSLIK